MPGNVAPVADEREGLLRYLEQARYVLRLTAHGLTDEQARATPTASALSIGGLIKHVAATERYWMGLIQQRPAAGSTDDYVNGFRLSGDETLAGVLEDYEAVGKETERLLDGIADLGQPVPVPRDAPWFPRDVDAWSVRWVLLHMITETSRHAGHADLVRELVDGAAGLRNGNDNLPAHDRAWWAAYRERLEAVARAAQAGSPG
jgi:uncharacterized damage-inducible protein DinB